MTTVADLLAKADAYQAHAELHLATIARALADCDLDTALHYTPLMQSALLSARSLHMEAELFQMTQDSPPIGEG